MTSLAILVSARIPELFIHRRGSRKGSQNAPAPVSPQSGVLSGAPLFAHGFSVPRLEAE